MLIERVRGTCWPSTVIELTLSPWDLNKTIPVKIPFVAVFWNVISSFDASPKLAWILDSSKIWLNLKFSFVLSFRTNSMDDPVG